MRALTVARMQQIDEATIAEVGVPALVLMERAALQSRHLLMHVAPERMGSGRPALILAGAGNNGGDALALARLLTEAGKPVRVWALPSRSPAAGAQGAILEQWPLDIALLDERTDLVDDLAACDLVIDGLFGIGLSRPIDGWLAALIRQVNRADRPVLALDLPSGLDGDTGAVQGICLQARWTVSFGWPKLGLLTDQALEWVGEVWVAEIGMPRRLADDSPYGAVLPELGRALVPSVRAAASHKGDFGRVLLVGGSQSMPGAIQLATAAALAGGAGYVTTALPEALIPTVAARWPAALFLPLPSGPNEQWDRILTKASVVAIGPGLGQEQAAADLVETVLQEALQPVLLDADALNLLATHRHWLDQRYRPTILTPHPAEAGRLLGCGPTEVQRDRWAAASRLAKATGAVVLLKGARTLVAAPDGTVRANLSGSPALARGGSGDVLTGLIAALIAQGLDPVTACTAAAWWHGAAAEAAARRAGLLTATWEAVLAALGDAWRDDPAPAPLGLHRLG